MLFSKLICFQAIPDVNLTITTARNPQLQLKNRFKNILPCKIHLMHYSILCLHQVIFRNKDNTNIRFTICTLHPNIRFTICTLHPNITFTISTLHPNIRFTISTLQPKIRFTICRLYPNIRFTMCTLRPIIRFSMCTLHHTDFYCEDHKVNETHSYFITLYRNLIQLTNFPYFICIFNVNFSLLTPE